MAIHKDYKTVKHHLQTRYESYSLSAKILSLLWWCNVKLSLTCVTLPEMEARNNSCANFHDRLGVMFSGDCFKEHNIFSLIRIQTAREELKVNVLSSFGAILLPFCCLNWSFRLFIFHAAFFWKYASKRDSPVHAQHIVFPGFEPDFQNVKADNNDL